MMKHEGKREVVVTGGQVIDLTKEQWNGCMSAADWLTLRRCLAVQLYLGEGGPGLRDLYRHAVLQTKGWGQAANSP